MTTTAATTTAERHELVGLRIVTEHDVFLARQRGRDVAAIVGLENQDQVRVATAISELTRELAGLDAPTTVTIAMAAQPRPALLITATWSGRLGGARDHDALAAVDGIAAAARLTDGCDLTWHADGGSVVLAKKLPPGSEALTPQRIATLRSACRDVRPGNALDGLRIQNQDLLSTLDDLRARQEDLLRANAELEETNRGVLALHAELSEELEKTNQGVVALYAELDEATGRLQEVNESKTRFWRNVSHELRTPLNSVIGLSRLLLDPGSDPITSEQRHRVELIRDSGATLLSLVNELLDVAKAEAGQIEIRPRLTDLGTVLGHLEASLQPMVTSPEVDLVVEAPDPPVVLWTDPGLLGQILRNLVSNAVEFTERGRVRCTAGVQQDGDMVEIVVADTGIGIPPEHRERVFEEFHQVPGPLQRHRSGSGLGLPHAGRLAGVLGGALDLQSEPGTGTTVTFRMPMRADATPAGRYHRVLVVDDDPGFREIAHGALGPYADRVIDAEDGAAALRAMRAERPDLVMLDLDIPPPDGSAVLDEMRRDADLDDVPVVIVTSADLDGAHRARLAATTVVVGKSSFTPELLLHAAAAAARLVGGPP
ncbi:ATP-binding protein [Pseudonocardia sp. MH-G8]|uniref:ATP-binding response regulator n=1 Tax=Pseudonocardia sp. MH-G8 TaxID=1854588 RepID=UPI0013041586|nr:ATP-binding protein [Pseudonocardia sp. MH-G8]